MRRYSFRYTVHAPNRTNLAYGYNAELEKAILRASIESCNQIGPKRLVYHSSLQALDVTRTGNVLLPDDDEHKRGKECEINALSEIAPFFGIVSTFCYLKLNNSQLNWKLSLCSTGCGL